MAPKTTCLFFGIIFIALQFCYVSCYYVYDEQASINLTVNPKTDGRPRELHFSCEVYVGIISSDYTCKFQLSDGTFIEYNSRTLDHEMKRYDPLGVYEYTIKDKPHYAYATCSIIIPEPFGQLVSRDKWKCWIIARPGTYSSYQTLKIQTTDSTPTGSTKKPTAAPIALRPIISSNKVQVKRGDNFKIGCQVMESIDYCFLQSPNGTMFAVAYYKKNLLLKSSMETLIPTTDSDFSVGDCFAVIENADDSHNGNWRCQLERRWTKEEIETIVPVTVEESYLLTSVEKVPQTTKTIIKCTAITALSSKIINCRWTFPNGTGIYEKNVSNIEVSHNDTSCVLKLNDWNHDYEGEWSCFAAFKNDFGDKFHASKFFSI